MGNDTPLSVLSNQSQPLFGYFKQLFAQVTNPPLDAIREELVTSLESFIGSEQDLFDESPRHCRQLKLMRPMLTNRDLEKVRSVDKNGIRAVTLPMLFPPGEGPGALEKALDHLCRQASEAVDSGYQIIVLSDRGLNSENAAIRRMQRGGSP